MDLNGRGRIDVKSLNSASPLTENDLGQVIFSKLSFFLYKIRITILTLKGSCKEKMDVKLLITADGTYFRQPGGSAGSS